MRLLVQNRDSPTFVSMGYLTGRWCGVQSPKQITGRLLSQSEACSPSPFFLISSWPTPHRGPPKVFHRTQFENQWPRSQISVCIQIPHWSCQMWLLIHMFWGGPEILCFWSDPNWCLSVWSGDSILKSKGLITDCLWPFTSFDSEFLLLLWLCHKKKKSVAGMFLLRAKSSTIQMWKLTWDMKETESICFSTVSVWNICKIFSEEYKLG